MATSLTKTRRKESDARWRAGIASCFEILRNIIPNGKLHPKRKISKALILKETGNHISFLEKVIDILLTEIATTNDPLCANLKQLSLEKIREEFLETHPNHHMKTGDSGKTDTQPKQRLAGEKIQKKDTLSSKKAGKHKHLNPRLSSVHTDLALAVCVRETELRDALNGSSRDVLAIRNNDSAQNTESQLNNSWNCGKIANRWKGNKENFSPAPCSDETSTPTKQATSLGLPGDLPITLSPIEYDREDYGLPPPTPNTPLDGSVFSFNFNNTEPSPSGLTPIKLLHPVAIPALATSPNSGSETESATETPYYKYGDNSRTENVDDMEKSLLCEEKFENIDFGDEIERDESPFGLIARPSVRPHTIAAVTRPYTPPNATPPMKRSFDMMQNRRPPPKCRRKLEASFPEPTVQGNENKLSEGNDFDGFLVFYKQLVGQLEKYLTSDEVKSKATFSMISRMWKMLPADQKNTVIAMAMMDEFMAGNESLDEDLKDLAVAPIDPSPHKAEAGLDLDEFYAKAMQQVLCMDVQHVPDVPLTGRSGDGTDMFEVQTANIKSECHITSEMALATAGCLEESNESQGSNNSGSFVPAFTNLKIDGLDLGIDRDLFTVAGLYSNHQSNGSMWANISLDKMMESD